MLKNLISKSVKKNLKQNKRIPKISTRGFYDLSNGKTKKNQGYILQPKNLLDVLKHTNEITIMIHGLRNNESGASAKFQIAQKRLKDLDYHFPIIGFSYDSNTKGVQYRSCEKHATKVGIKIAKKNGKNLARFVTDMKRNSPSIKIRLMGHSLGSQVILSTLEELKNRQFIQAAYVFGASIPSDSLVQKKYRNIINNTIKEKFVNYYSKFDDVLKYAFEQELIPKPLGYSGINTKTVAKYSQKHVHPKNHRFISYAKTIKSYP